MTVVFFEGPDGVGKTGLAEWFARELGFVFVAQQSETRLTGEQGMKPIAFARSEVIAHLETEGVNMVVDRSPFTAIAYAHIHARSHPAIADNMLRDINGMCVYVRCDPRELEARRSDYDDEPNPGVVAEKYDELLTTDCPYFDRVFIVDTTTGILDALQDIGPEVIS